MTFKAIQKASLEKQHKAPHIPKASPLPPSSEDGNSLSSPGTPSLLHGPLSYTGSPSLSLLRASAATSQVLFLLSDALFIVICLSSVSCGEFQLPVLTTLYTVLPLMPT